MWTKNESFKVLVLPFVGLFFSAVIHVSNYAIIHLFGPQNIVNSFVTTFFSTLPKYDTLIAIGGLFATLIFPVAPFLESRKNYITHIDNEIYKKMSKYAIYNSRFKKRMAFKAIDDLKENILHCSCIIIYGMVVFIAILIILSTFCWTLLWSWISLPSPPGQKYPVIGLTIYFCLFLSAISGLYVMDLTYSFRNLFKYRSFLKNKEKYNKLKKRLDSNNDNKSEALRHKGRKANPDLNFFWWVYIPAVVMGEITIGAKYGHDNLDNLSAEADDLILIALLLLCIIIVINILLSVRYYFKKKNHQTLKVMVVIIVMAVEIVAEIVASFLIAILINRIFGLSLKLTSDLFLFSCLCFISTNIIVSIVYNLKDIFINFRENIFIKWFPLVAALLSWAVVLGSYPKVLERMLANSDNSSFLDSVKFMFPVFVYTLIECVFLVVIYHYVDRKKNPQTRLANLRKIVSDIEEDIKFWWETDSCVLRGGVEKEVSQNIDHA